MSKSGKVKGSESDATASRHPDTSVSSRVLVAASLSAVHTSVAATGWERSSSSVRRAVDTVAKLSRDAGGEAGLPPVTRNKGTSAPTQRAALEVTVTLDRQTAIVASRRFYAAEPCRLDGTTPHALPLLSVHFNASLKGELQLGTAPLPYPASLTFRLSDMAAQPAAAVPPQPTASNSFPSSDPANGVHQPHRADEGSCQVVDMGAVFLMSQLQVGPARQPP
jgi:hypothetical protein